MQEKAQGAVSLGRDNFYSSMAAASTCSELLIIDVSEAMIYYWY